MNPMFRCNFLTLDNFFETILHCGIKISWQHKKVPQCENFVMKDTYIDAEFENLSNKIKYL